MTDIAARSPPWRRGAGIRGSHRRSMRWWIDERDRPLRAGRARASPAHGPASSSCEGQSKIDGLILNFNVRGMEFSVVLPTQIKQSTMQLFETHYANLPHSDRHVTAYIFAYAEFLLPICLILGFVTRFSALVLLILTVLTAVYVTPAEFWTTQVYWIVDPGGAAVDRPGRNLVRRADPLSLPARQGPGISLTQMYVISRIGADELCQRQRGRRRAGNSRGDCPRQRQAPRWLTAGTTGPNGSSSASPRSSNTRSRCFWCRPGRRRTRWRWRI